MPSKRVRKEKKDRSRRNRKYRLWCKRNDVACSPQVISEGGILMREYEVEGYKVRWLSLDCEPKHWYSTTTSSVAISYYN